MSRANSRGLRARFSISVVTAFVVWLGVAGAASAQTFTLSGTVTGGGSPISGATVEALTNGTTTVAGSSTTNASGQYSIPLAPAIYDLRVTPPAGSAFNQEVLQDVDLTASNQQLDVILISSGGGGPQTYAVTGTVRGFNGTPLPGTRVYLYQPSRSTVTTLTDANGVYSLQAVTGNAYMEFYSSTPSSAAPQSWYFYQSSLAVGTGAVFDVNLSVARLSGVITDIGGNPIPGATVAASASDSVASTGWSASSSATANASGAYSVLLVTGSGSVTARPPTGAPFGVAQSNFTLSGDTTLNVALPNAATVSGVVKGLNGQPISGARVQASGGGNTATTTTAADGSYTLNAGPGTVSLYFTRNTSSSPNAPSSWEYYLYSLAVTGATIYNLDLPIVAVTGTVTNTTNTPVANAVVTASSGGSNDQSSWNANSNSITSAGGSYAMLLFSGSGNFTVRPPTGSSSAATSGSATLSGDIVKDFVLPDPVVVSGTVRGIGGQAVSGAQVFAVYSGGSLSVMTDTAGNYSLPVPPGTLSYLRFSRGSLSPAAPNSWTVYRYNVPVTGPTTIDLSLDVIRLSGQAQDSNGAPIPGVMVSAGTYRYDNTNGLTEWYSDASVTTSAGGSYSILTLTGSGSVTIRPPTNSGFSQVTLNPVTFANNFTQRIVLQRPDTTAPVIVAGPAVLHLSDTSVSIGWTTNEPSTSIVDYGIGGFTQQIASTTLVTQHTVTLQNLTPNEIYSFRVSSRDRNNNGPVQSGTGFFTSLAPPGDVTPPAILAGPVTAFLGNSSAIVQWLTNEPASTVVRYGTTAAFGSEVASGPGDFLGLHAALLPGLSPSTDYFAQVESSDPDGNTVISSTFTFRTAAAPDIQAPVITSAPTVVARTHNSATIRWFTDEAATSGISYNDGTVFNVTSDEALTTMHEIVLAGLTPARTYNFTAASRDAGGNGPTLAGPFSFTTLAAPDTTPPSLGDITVTPTKNTAAFVWTTNEAASTVVRFGSTPGAPNQVVADLALLTSHQLTLTGLLPGTTYFYSLVATDAAGNTISTVELSFDTLPEDVNTPPTPPAPVTASPNPGNTGSFTLTWGAPADDGPGGVKEVQVLRADLSPVSPPLAPTATSYLITGATEGSHTFRIRATDFDDASSLSDPVTVVVDLSAPSLTLPSPITTPATSNIDAIVVFTVTASDNFDADPVESCSPSSGSAFPIGQTTVNCTGRDAAGNVSSGSFTVTVTDPFAPVLTVPAPISLQAENQNGATVMFTATAVDNHDPNPSVSCVPPSGSVFPIGMTQVICTATDASGNTATRSFNVSIGAPPKVASTIVVQSSSPTSTYGQPVTFTATVTGTNGSTPTGTVTFHVDGVAVGQAALGSDSPVTASLTTSTLPAGTRSITASYPGDFGHETSTASAVTVDVAKAQPAISVTGGTFVYDASPHAASGSVTGAGGVSIGTLTFTYDGSSTLPVSVGTYAVVGSFAGSDDYEAGSATGTLAINPGPTQTAVQPGPSIVFGQSATLTASVTSPTGQVPQGTVEFFDGAASLGSATLNGAGLAQIVAGSLGAATHTISAVYGGGGNFAASVSAGAALEVARAATTTSLTVVPNPAGLLESFKATATVAIAAPGAGSLTGTVEFFVGDTPLGNASLTLVSGVPTASVTMNGFPAGTYQISARYAGTSSFAPSSSAPVSQVVRAPESSTWTAVSVSPTPSSRAGTSITIRAFVVPIAGTTLPTGMVQFYVWGSPLGSPVALVNAGGTMTATLTTAALPSGLMQLHARYLGNPTFAPSTAVPVSHTVYASTAPFATTTTITVSSNPVPFGSPLTVTASVVSGTRPTPGYMLLSVDGTPVQAAAVVSGVPTSFVVAGSSKGLHTITVQFVPSTTTLAGSLANTFVLVQ